MATVKYNLILLNTYNFELTPLSNVKAGVLTFKLLYKPTGHPQVFHVSLLSNNPQKYRMPLSVMDILSTAN